MSLTWRWKGHFWNFMMKIYLQKKLSWTAYFVLLRTFRAVGGVWVCLWINYSAHLHCNEGKCHRVWLTDVVLIVSGQQRSSVALGNNLCKSSNHTCCLGGGGKCCLGLRKLQTFSCIIRVWAWVCFFWMLWEEGKKKWGRWASRDRDPKKELEWEWVPACCWTRLWLRGPTESGLLTLV